MTIASPSTHLGRKLGIQLALVVGLAAAGLPADAATNASIEAKRRQAAKISAQIDATATRIEQLNEDYLSAQERLATLKRRLASSTTEQGAVTARLAGVRRRLRDQALRAFADPTGSGLDAVEGSESASDFERRLALEQRLGGTSVDLADQLRADQADLARATRQLADARKSAAATTALLARQKREADGLIEKLERLEQSAKGDLAVLVRQEEQRRAAAEAKAAADALAKRQAAARAALAKAQAAARGKSARTKSGVVTSPARPDPSLRALEIEAGDVPAVPTSPGAAKAVQVAMAQLGKPYVWGADGPGSFDCSGLMLYAWSAAGRRLPHSSRSQFSGTTRVPVSGARPGDLVFFGHPIHHVGMYIGNGKMVEASRRGKPVKISSIFRRDLVGIGRVG